MRISRIKFDLIDFKPFEIHLSFNIFTIITIEKVTNCMIFWVEMFILGSKWTVNMIVTDSYSEFSITQCEIIFIISETYPTFFKWIQWVWGKIKEKSSIWGAMFCHWIWTKSTNYIVIYQSDYHKEVWLVINIWMETGLNKLLEFVK